MGRTDGAYFVLYPHARVVTLIPPFIFGPFFAIPAVIFLGWWFIPQFFNGSLSLLRRGDGGGGIAWWAHIGGFAFGALMCIGLKMRERKSVLQEYEDP